MAAFGICSAGRTCGGATGSADDSDDRRRASAACAAEAAAGSDVVASVALEGVDWDESAAALDAAVSCRARSHGGSSGRRTREWPANNEWGEARDGHGGTNAASDEALHNGSLRAGDSA